MTNLLLEWRDDETCMVYLDGSFVSSIDHETMGWDGMRQAIHLLDRIAGFQGWEVEVAGDPGL